MGQRLSRVGKHRFMIYLPRDTYERLRTIAFNERTSINKLVVEAVHDALARRAPDLPGTSSRSMKPSRFTDVTQAGRATMIAGRMPRKGG